MAVTTILGTSRMVPNDAVLRWPRLNWGGAAKTHTHTHTAANTTSMQMQTNRDWGDSWTQMRVVHMQSIRCTCKGSMHPVSPTPWAGLVLRRLSAATPLLLCSAQTTAGVQLQCCLDRTWQSTSMLVLQERYSLKVILKSENIEQQQKP